MTLNNQDIKSPYIELKNVFMKYNKKDNIYSLNDVSFKINHGDFHALLGSNGAGKSTTIKILSGLNNDFSGKFLVNGFDAKKENCRTGFSYVIDHPVFPSEFSVFEYLFYFVSLVRKDYDQLKLDIDFYLEKFEISNLKKKKANNLSSGQKQKVVLIRTILEKPKFIILDEPFSNLDPKSRYQMSIILQEMNIKTKTTILISSHIINELIQFANSATIIEQGKILFNSSLQNKDLNEIYTRLVIKPKNNETFQTI